MATGSHDLVDRLRGIYRIPVKDGAGPLDGKTEYTRKFETSPIMHEAADEIERLRRIEEAAKCIRHWHDAHNGGMVVSGDHVRALWSALANKGLTGGGTPSRADDGYPSPEPGD